MKEYKCDFLGVPTKVMIKSLMSELMLEHHFNWFLLQPKKVALFEVECKVKSLI